MFFIGTIPYQNKNSNEGIASSQCVSPKLVHVAEVHNRKFNGLRSVQSDFGACRSFTNVLDSSSGLVAQQSQTGHKKD